MATQPTPYIKVNPGDLILAEDIDSMQVQIKQDIANKIADAVGGIKKVDQAGDAGTLDGKNLQQIEDEVLKKVLGEIPKQQGYQMLFKRLKVNEPKVINHKLGTCPLVDIYQLDYFKAVCPEDENTRILAMVNFYLYHTSEKKIRTTITTTATPPATQQVMVEIEVPDSKNPQPFKIPFTDMLDRYKVKYTDTSSLEDLVNDFWKTFLHDPPNDDFDQDQYCHSPWFDRCCREQITVKELRDRGDLDDIWFKMVPRKTINYPTPAAAAPDVAPTQIQVAHFDFDSLEITLLKDPIPAQVPTPPPTYPTPPKDQLKVMVLLKV